MPARKLGELLKEKISRLCGSRNLAAHHYGVRGAAYLESKAGFCHCYLANVIHCPGAGLMLQHT